MIRFFKRLVLLGLLPFWLVYMFLVIQPLTPLTLWLLGQDADEWFLKLFPGRWFDCALDWAER